MTGKFKVRIIQVRLYIVNIPGRR